MMIPIDDAETLSRIFHLNSEPWLNEEAYRGNPFHQEYKNHPAATARIPLPDPHRGQLASLFSSRHSTRAFADWTMPLSVKSNLLFSAYGVVEIAKMETGGKYLRRSVPSAGALYPLELYLLLRRIDKLEDGLYHYDSISHALEQIWGGDWSPACQEAFYTYPFIVGANAVVCYSAVFSRCQTKYGPRGYRYILLEAGHSAQNVCITAEDLGLATLCMGGFKDSILNSLLGLSPLAEGAVYTVAVGKAMPE
jgi:SagB-type dehydrogenase family enzyme